MTEESSLCKIFVGGIPRNIEKEDLLSYFQQFGTVTDHVVIKGDDNQSRGFGFVVFQEPDAVERVLDPNSCAHNIGGKEVDVKRAMPKEISSEQGCHEKVKKLFIGGLSKDVDDESLMNYLTERHGSALCGQILSATVKRDRDTNQSKGFGFIETSTTHLADRIAIAEHSCFIQGRKSNVKKAIDNQGGSGSRGRGRGGSDSRGGGRGGFGSGSYSRGGGAQNNYGNAGFNQQDSYGARNGGYNTGYNTGYNAGGYGGNYGGRGAGAAYPSTGMTSYPNQSQYGGYSGY